MPEHGRRVLVTGAAGFIGANLVRALLERGQRVGAVVRPEGSRSRLAGLEGELELITVDLRVGGELESAIARFRPELAVNLAMTPGDPGTREGRLEQLEVSVLGTVRLVEALAASGSCALLVHMGSSLEYGPKSQPMHEGNVLAPIVPRGAAKAAASLACLAWSRALDLSAVVLRLFTAYGPFESPSRLVPSALRAALIGEELPLADGGTARDFVYVGDVVDAIVRALDQPALGGQILNLGTGRQTTLQELVDAVGCVTGRVLRVRPGAHDGSPYDASRWVADMDHTRRVLGWEPATDLEAGLRQTLAWLTGEDSGPRELV